MIVSDEKIIAPVLSGAGSVLRRRLAVRNPGDCAGDVEHSTEDEKRAIAFGSTGLGQVVYVVHIQHTPDHTHLISAHEAEPPEEVDFYERVYGKGNRDRGTQGAT